MFQIVFLRSHFPPYVSPLPPPATAAAEPKTGLVVERDSADQSELADSTLHWLTGKACRKVKMAHSYRVCAFHTMYIGKLIGDSIPCLVPNVLLNKVCSIHQFRTFRVGYLIYLVAKNLCAFLLIYIH